MAAPGTLITLGATASVRVSFIGTPVITINPFIGVGLFSGTTEAALRKPWVSDTQTISDDVSSLRRIYRNRITKALLVFLLSSLGGRKFYFHPLLGGAVNEVNSVHPLRYLSGVCPCVRHNSRP